MGVRELFVGEALHEVPLGTTRSGLRRIQRVAFIGMIDEHPELFLERTGTLFPFSASVTWTHLPDDGMDAVESVARTVIEGPPADPPTGAERVVRAATLATQWLATLAAFTVLAGAVVGGMASLTNGFGGRLAGAWLPGPLSIFLYVALGFFGPMLVHWLTTWGGSRLLGEPIVATATRTRFGHPLRIEPMGTWQGPYARDSKVARTLYDVHLHVMAVEDRLVIGRSSHSFASAHLKLFSTPAHELPALLDTIATWRDLREIETAAHAQ